MSLKQYLGKKLAGLRLAHEAVMVADAAGVLKDNRAQNRAHSQRFSRKNDTPSTNADEDMGIHVGDVKHEHHYHGSQSPQQPQGTSTVKKLAVAAALVGTGVAAPYALPAAMALVNEMNKPEPSPAVTDTDTDTSVDIELETTGGIE